MRGAENATKNALLRSCDSQNGPSERSNRFQLFLSASRRRPL